MLIRDIGTNVCSVASVDQKQSRIMDIMDEYDVVMDTLTRKKNELWKITRSNMNNDMVNIMDDIRLQQIQELNEAMGMWLLWKDEQK